MFEIAISHLYGAIGSLLTVGWCNGFYGGRTFGMMGGYWPFSMVFMGIFWIAVVALAVWAFWRLAAGTKTAPAAGHLDILKRRLAEGEITMEEFNKLKKTLDEKK